jgi:hypothetical protein
MAMLESRFNRYACRYEPGYQWLYKPEMFAKRIKCTLDTMIAMQSTSYGLMQVMGAYLYEVGGPDHYDTWPTELIDPEINLEISCKILQKIHKKYKNPLDIYACYKWRNGGSVRRKNLGQYLNQKNVDHFADCYNEMPRDYGKMIKHVSRLTQ